MICHWLSVVRAAQLGPQLKPLVIATSTPEVGSYRCR
jgi:hypothetical protein